MATPTEVQIHTEEDARENITTVEPRVSRCTVLSMFIISIPVGLLSVIVVAHWLTQASGSGQVHGQTVNLFEMIFLITSLVVMFYIGIDKYRHGSTREGGRDAGHNIQEQAHQISWVYKIPLRLLVLIFLCAGSLMLLIFQAANITCLVNVKPRGNMETIKAASYWIKILFFICQMIFICLFRNDSFIKDKEKHALASILASDGCVFVKYIYDVGTIDNKSFPYFPLPGENDNQSLCDIKLTEKSELFLKWFLIEYAMLSIAFLCKMMIKHEERLNEIAEETTNDVEDTSDPNEHSRLLGNTTTHRRYWWFFATIRFISQYAIYISAVFVIIIFTIIAYYNYSYEKTISRLIDDDVLPNTTVLDQNSRGNHAITYTELTTTYILTVVGGIGFFFARKERSTAVTHVVDKCILLIASCAYLILILFETVENILEEITPKTSEAQNGKIFFYGLNTAFRYLCLYFQTALILKVNEIRILSSPSFCQLFVRGIVVYIGIFNAERWIEDIWLLPFDMIETNGDNRGLGGKNWWQVVRLLYPVACFNRLYAAILCFESLAKYIRL